MQIHLSLDNANNIISTTQFALFDFSTHTAVNSFIAS